jgi:hypothetical protein
MDGFYYIDSAFDGRLKPVERVESVFREVRKRGVEQPLIMTD